MPDLFVRTCLSLVLSLAAVGSACAQEQDSKIFSFGGFGTLGAAYSNADQADIVRDLLQPDGVGHTRKLDFGLDSILGLQVNANFTDSLDGAVQIVSRRTRTNFDPELAWAYIGYAPNDTVRLRAGRLGFDVYPLADSRNVGLSYLWVRPPIDYFGSLIISYLDGADLVLKRPLAGGEGRIKLFAGLAREKIPTIANFPPFSLDHSRIAGGHLEWQSEKWLLRLGYAQMRFHNEFPGLSELMDGLRSPPILALNPASAQLADDLAFQGKLARYASMGAVYENGPLQAQFMLSRIQSDSLGYPDNVAGYITLGYRVRQWTPYITYSATRPRANPRDVGLPLGVSPAIDSLVQGASGLMRSQLADQTTWSLGARYNLKENIDVKLQLDRIRARETLLERNELPSWNGKATLFSVAVDFVF
jgi:hypothetical protein